jgi:hypothetical protein
MKNPDRTLYAFSQMDGPTRVFVLSDFPPHVAKVFLRFRPINPSRLLVPASHQALAKAKEAS